MLRNIIANWSFIFVSAISVYALYPFYIDVLGAEQYGVWLLISSIIGYFSLIQMGVPLANVRFVSKYYAKGDFDKLNEVLGANLFLFIWMAGITVFFGLAISLFLDRFFQIPLEYLYYAKIGLIIAALEVGLRFVFEAVEGVLNARREFVFINGVRNVITILRVALSFLLISNDCGLLWVASLLLLSTIIQSICFYLCVSRKYPKIKLLPKKATREMFKDIFSYSGFVLLLQLSSRISFQTDALVLASVVSVTSVVWFGVANSILLYLTQMVVGVSKVLMPQMSELDSLGDNSKICSVFLTSTRMVGLLVFPICLLLYYYGGEFIQLWMKDSFRPEMYEVLSILLVGYVFFLVQRGTTFPVLMGVSKMKWPTIVMFVAAIFNLVSSIWFGKIYGVYGVAWATSIPTICVALFLLAYISSILSIPILKCLINSTLIPGVSLLPIIILFYCFDSFDLQYSYLALIFKIGVSMILTFLFDLFLVDKIYRGKFMNIISKVKGATI